MRTRFFAIFISLVLGIFLSSCGSLKEPELLGIENVRTGRVGLIESSLTLNLHYFNPNNKRLKFQKGEGDAWLDGNPLGHFTIDSLIHIPARAEFSLPVKMIMDMRYFMENMSAALSGKEVTLKVDGMARAGKGIVFINYPLHYEGKQKLSDLLK
ncbi:MAG TPA: LEA type 2 family protein [Chitinophagaceae bacterium]|nr:LEA type 2 family protein [Chitinophagaceae bacterium]